MKRFFKIIFLKKNVFFVLHVFNSFVQFFFFEFDNNKLKKFYLKEKYKLFNTRPFKKKKKKTYWQKKNTMKIKTVLEMQQIVYLMKIKKKRIFFFKKKKKWFLY